MRSTSELQATLRPPGKLTQPIILGLLGEHMIKTTKPSGAGMVKITFSLPPDEPTGAVSVVGDFNNWDPSAHPLRVRSNQTRSASVTVPEGSRLRFRYLAEGGMWFDDETIPAVGGGDPVLAV
jgi:1,4-alpha-glucan branching enzyme